LVVADVPELLTVEDAARLARIGRTKAYAMAREWRDSGGRSGLPVVDFGHVLRVPRRALEALIGAELTDLPSIARVPATRERRSSPPESQTSAPTPRESTPPTRRRHREPSNQLDLFASTPPTP
jgi:Helix-turn-helix domain